MTIPPGSVADLFERALLKGSGPFALLTAQDNKEFEAAFDAWLEHAVNHLEANKKNFMPLDEEGLSAVLAAALSAAPFITATQETNSNGHVDLTIEVGFVAPLRRKLGEAKIYNGPAYHFEGLDQLLGRYTTGREGRGILVVYVRKPNVAGLMKKLRDAMDNDLPHQQKGASKDHLLKWSFVSLHSHSCGEDLEVGHVGCNLYVDENQENS